MLFKTEMLQSGLFRGCSIYMSVRLMCVCQVHTAKTNGGLYFLDFITLSFQIYFSISAEANKAQCVINSRPCSTVCCSTLTSIGSSRKSFMKTCQKRRNGERRHQDNRNLLYVPVCMINDINRAVSIILN